ncbi:MAG TPA: hypothetical protein VF126_00865 [Acidobacteriaceae bacterium]
MLRGLDGFFSFSSRHNCHIVESIIPLSAHPVEETKMPGFTVGRCFAANSMIAMWCPSLLSWPLTIAQHQGKRAFNHCFICDLKSRFRINREILSGSRCPLFCVREKVLNLLRIYPLRFGFVHPVSLALKVILSDHLDSFPLPYIH